MYYRDLRMSFILSSFLLIMTLNSKPVQGVYALENRPEVKLIFSGDNFIFVKPEDRHLGRYSCCDTVTKGKFRVQGNLVVLSTPQFNELDSLKIAGIESESNSKDTLYINVSSPLEAHDNIESGAGREVYYSVYIMDKYLVMSKTAARRFDSRLIKIPKPANVNLDKFMLLIYPSEYYNGKNNDSYNFFTSMYQVKNKNSNYFNINIPDFGIEYMSYIRLKDDFVRIVDRNNLEWHGEIYKKIKK